MSTFSEAEKPIDTFRDFVTILFSFKLTIFMKLRELSAVKIQAGLKEISAFLGG